MSRILLWLLVAGLILLSLATGAMRLLVGNIELFKSEIEFLLEREVHQGIVFNEVSGAMNRFNPVLRIDNVSINLPDRSQPLFIDRLEVEFDFWRSLHQNTPVVFEISGQLEKLEVTRDPEGQWWLDQYRIDSDDEQIRLPGFSRVMELLPRYLKLDLRRLVVNDASRQTRHQLTGVQARIVHREGRFLTQVRADLPQEFGRSLEVRSVIENQASRIYLDAASLRLVPIARLFGVATRGLRQGVLDGKLWLDMSGYQVSEVQGDIRLSDGLVQVARDKPTLAIAYHARLDASRRGQRWRVSSKVDSLSVDGETVPPFDAEIGLPVSRDDDLVAVAISQLPIESLPVVAGQWLPGELHRQIAQGRLDGSLRQLLVEVNLEQADTIRLGARVIGLNSRTIGLIPGIDRLSADLVVGHNKLAAVLVGRNVTVDFGDQFRAPLQADALSMNIVMNRLPSGNLLLESERMELVNRDVSAIGRLRLETDGEQAPFMFLRATFKDAIGASTGKYIPVQLMPKEAIDWLDRGIVGGFVPAGDLQYHGRLRDIRELAREQAVEFFVDFRVEQANIFFADDWLNVTDGYGKVLFHNVGVDFDIDSASYEQIDGIRAFGRIADFDNASLELAIATEAGTGDALRVWQGTPVGRRFSDVLDRVRDPGGEVDAEIDLVLPLGDGVFYRKVEVGIDLRGAAGRIPEWGLDLSAVDGRLKATEDTLSASGIAARFFGDPVRIDIDSRNSAINTAVSVRGNLASANLLRPLPAYLVEPLSGNSDWRLLLNIAGDDVPEGRHFLHIQAASTLQDTRISAPRPFAKNAADLRALRADVFFHDDEIRFAGYLGDDVQGRGLLRGDGDGAFRLDRLDIAFNTGFQRDQKPGINLYGQIEQTSLDDWFDFLRGSGHTDSSLLNEVVLGIDRGTVLRREFSSAVVELNKLGDALDGRIDASIVKGRFRIPLQPRRAQPMVFDLDHLAIDEVAASDEPPSLRPSQVAPLRLSSRELRYHDMRFNDLELEAYPENEVLKVENFRFRRDAVWLTGSSRWRFDEARDRHDSSLQLAIAGPGLGGAMSGLGFGDSLTGGEIDASGEFRWPAPLMAFELGNVSGSASLKVVDGIMNNVEPGSGRFVGLLSLSALPRRLALDFSDVVVEGMEFDFIEGSYRIDEGELHTENTVMDGPAARIRISGKTGIIERDYDQVMRIAPKIGDTLPLIGAISAGSTVGWGLLILQQLFDTVIDDAVEVEYRVTGSWDDPQIELIKAVDENQNDLPKIEK